MSNEILIGELEKNAAETVRVQLMRLTVGPYVDIRIWATARPGDGPGLHRTDRGFMVSAELLPELRKLIERAIAAVEFEKGGGKTKPEISQKETPSE
jgi:hypothetical protein